MGLRKKLVERTQPLLPPHAQVRAAMPAYLGTSPNLMMIGAMFGLIGGLIATCFLTPVILVITDDAIVVMSSGYVRWKPKRIVGILPRTAPLAPAPSIAYARLRATCNGKALWVHRGFRKDVLAADAASGFLQTPRGLTAGPVLSPDGHYWWDGRSWVPVASPEWAVG